MGSDDLTDTLFGYLRARGVEGLEEHADEVREILRTSSQERQLSTAVAQQLAIESQLKVVDAIRRDIDLIRDPVIRLAEAERRKIEDERVLQLAERKADIARREESRGIRERIVDKALLPTLAGIGGAIAHYLTTL